MQNELCNFLFGLKRKKTAASRLNSFQLFALGMKSSKFNTRPDWIDYCFEFLNCSFKTQTAKFAIMKLSLIHPNLG